MTASLLEKGEEERVEGGSWTDGSSGRMSRATLPISNTLPPRLETGGLVHASFVHRVCEDGLHEGYIILGGR